MAVRTCRIGVHGRNNVTFEAADYQAVTAAGIETVKMMGQTQPQVFATLKRNTPTIELITRLYDDRFGVNKRPSPEAFVARQLPVIRQLQAYCIKYEIHNEPNHLHRFEGWGQEDRDAVDFNRWFLQVYQLLKQAVPWAELGFPGLAVPHRDLTWLDICRPAITQADWLGVHCYWQTPPGHERNHLHKDWGLRFKYYHQKFPNKVLEITEFGNSNIQAAPPIAITEAALAQQYAEYYQELFKYPYINSASAFILSSQDTTWDFFAWRSENGRAKTVVHRIGGLTRPPLMPATGFVSRGTSLAELGLVVQNIAGGLPAHQHKQYPRRQQQQIQTLIVHHTAVNADIGASRIAKVQVANGKAGISYHYFITAEGAIYQTNDLTTVSEHTAGFDNTGVAIAFAGNFTIEIPTAAQLQAGGKLIAALQQQLGLTSDSFKGASELINTQSPGRQWLGGQRWHDLLQTQIDAARRGMTPAPLPTPVIPTPTPPVQPPDPTPVTPPPTTPPTSPEDTARIAQLTAEVARLRTEYGAAMQQVMHLKGELNQVGQATQMLTNSQTQLQNLNFQVIQLQSRLLQAEQVIQNSAGLSNDLAVLRQENQTLQAELTRTREALNNATNNGSTNNGDIDGRIAALQERIAQLELQLRFAEEAAAGVGQPGGVAKMPPPPIRNLINDLPRHPSKSYQLRPVGNINKIIIHHSAIPANITAAQISRFHIQQNNWAGPGFHYFITAEGVIQQANELTTISFHAGAENATSIGVTFAGDFDQDAPTQAQLDAGAQLLAWLLSEFDLSLEQIKAHKAVADTPCPGEQWDSGESWGLRLMAAVESVQNRPVSSPPAATDPARKLIFHYLLFWQTETAWAADDLQSAANYIGKFRPSLGFEPDEAISAQYVTIVGGYQGVSAAVEEQLRAAQCQVERIAANSPNATKALFDNLVLTNRRFLTLTGD